MSTTNAPRLGKIAQQAAPWLRLFRGGVFEDNFLDVSGIEGRSWELARAELESAKLLSVEWDVRLAGRPYLRLPPTKTATGLSRTTLAQARVRHIEAYRGLMMAVRQMFHGPSPKHGMDILELEEANYRRAVAWAWDLGDKAKVAEMGDLFTKYLERAHRTDDRDRWVAWLAGAGPGEEAAVEEPGAVEDAAVPDEEIELPPAGGTDLFKAFERAVERVVSKAAPAQAAAAPAVSTARRVPATGITLQAPEDEPAAAPAPSANAVAEERRSEGARLQSEGAAAVAAGNIATAADLYQRALKCFQDAKDTAGMAETCRMFGALEEAAGRPDGASMWYERAKGMGGG